ncbi:MAP/microtubule affinity-regulating kinase 3 [Gaertneriomyces sp. JEL0708]|nr:MAP/microtubule affinity-regulating kinase 3 [Gaertneriomyces sp. JEL0708]
MRPEEKYQFRSDTPPPVQWADWSWIHIPKPGAILNSPLLAPSFGSNVGSPYGLKAERRTASSVSLVDLRELEIVSVGSGTDENEVGARESTSHEHERRVTGGSDTALPEPQMVDEGMELGCGEIVSDDATNELALSASMNTLVSTLLSAASIAPPLPTAKANPEPKNQPYQPPMPGGLPPVSVCESITITAGTTVKSSSNASSTAKRRKVRTSKMEKRSSRYKEDATSPSTALSRIVGHVTSFILGSVKEDGEGEWSFNVWGVLTFVFVGGVGVWGVVKLGVGSIGFAPRKGHGGENRTSSAKAKCSRLLCNGAPNNNGLEQTPVLTIWSVHGHMSPTQTSINGVAEGEELDSNGSDAHLRAGSASRKPQRKQSTHAHRIGNYDFVRTVGEGSFAKVKLAIHKLTGEKVAVKVVDKAALSDSYSQTHLHREAQIMRMLDHPNIVQLIEVMETKRELYLVLEYCGGGEVLDCIVAHGRLKEAEARRVFRQIVCALKYCHDRNVVHRDLKAENLLLSGDMQVKISVYSAPELIEGKKYVGPEVDLWSLGVNLYAMVVGDLPFADKDIKRLYEKILHRKYQIPDFVSDECKHLISNLLVLDPAKRLTCTQVLRHPWMVHGGSTSQAWADTGSDSGAEGMRIINSSAPVVRLRPMTTAEMDKELLDKMESFGFDRATTSRDVVSGKFNQAAGTYFSLLLKKQRDATGGAKGRIFDEIEAEKRDALQELVSVAGAKGGTTANLDFMSEELAKVLIQAERTRLMNRKSVGDSPVNQVVDDAKSKFRHKRYASATLASGKSNGLASATGSTTVGDKGHIPDTSQNGGRRHSFSPDSTPVNTGLRKRSTTNPVLHQGAGFAQYLKGMSEVAGQPGKGVGTPSSRMSSPSKIHTKSEPGTGPTMIKAARASLSHTNGSSLPPIRSTTPDPPASPVLTEGKILKKEENGSYLRSHRKVHALPVDESLYLDEAFGEVPVRGAANSELSQEPRTIRFAFNCYTTTSIPPQQLIERLLNTLGDIGIECIQDGYLCMCEFGSIRFEAEVCKLPRLRMYGLRLKRVGGDLWEYKRVCQRITEGLELPG